MWERWISCMGCSRRIRDGTWHGRQAIHSIWISSTWELHNGQMYVQRILAINNPSKPDVMPVVFDEDWYLFDREAEEAELPFE